MSFGGFGLSWLEQKDAFVFEEHVLDPRPGAIHAFPFDPDSDGDLDLAVALSQDSEEVLLFRNDGRGNLVKEEPLFAAMFFYGMSGIELADLDLDGDTDILVTNGDSLDGSLMEEPDPYLIHGLSWLENDGTGHFSGARRIVGHWGAYSVRAADLDRDGDLDMVVSSSQLPKIYPEAPIQGTIWLENDGNQNFTRHELNLDLPANMVSIEVIDIDQDGVPEVLGGTSDFQGRDIGHRLVMFTVPTTNR